METVPIQLPDGTVTPIRLFPGPNDDAPVVVMLPGLGVPAGFYDPVAQALVDAGFNAAIGELRGQGDSKPRPSASSAFGYQELVSIDCPATFEVVRERFPASTPFLMGHSMGGQIGVMYASRIRGRLGGLILVASGSPYHRGFPGIRAPGLYLGSSAMSVTANIAGFWPGDRVNVGGFGRQSKVLITDWARFARTGRMEPIGADIDYEERIARLTLPVLSITIEGDDLAPRRSAKNLVDKLSGAQVTMTHIDEPLGHNGWIRNPTAVSERVVAWLRAR